MIHIRPISASPVRLPPLRVAAAVTRLAETIDWGLALLNVPRHWRATQGAGVTVAVLDTGIDRTHPDLAAAIEGQRDFTGSRGGSADRHGHGTHVAGTIAARQDGRGVVGVAPQCRLLVGKVLDDDGNGAAESVAAGIDWACDAGADIISMSFGSPLADPAIQAAVCRAALRGQVLIAAAGNDGPDGDVHYPARWKETIAVAAVDRQGRAAAFSSRGPEIDIAAPGEDVLSTWVGGGYARLSGTSMAAPFVAGVAALVLSAHRNRPARTPIRDVYQLRAHLARTATDAGPPGHDPHYGWGLISPDNLLASSDSPGRDAPPPRVLLDGVLFEGVLGTILFQPRSSDA